MTLGEIIIQYRTEHGLSQRAFALQCGVSNGYISMLEEGINRNNGKPITPSINKLRLVASGMGMTLHELFGKADDMNIDLSASDDEDAPFPLTPHEKRLVTAYRDNPPMQPAVCRLLGIPDEGADQPRSDPAADIIETLRELEKEEAVRK